MTGIQAIPEEPLAPTGGVKVVDRVAAILECLMTGGPELGIGELSRATGMSKGTIHRLLGALMQHRMVDQNPLTHQYRLGLRLFELGSQAIAQVDLVALAHPFLRALAEEMGETAHLAVLRNQMVLYIAKVDGWHSLRMPSHVGQTAPLHCTALGKILLAHATEEEQSEYLSRTDLVAMTPNTITNANLLRAELATILRNGFSVDNEELEIGLRCIAGPIRDHTGSVIAAVSISGPTTRITTGKTSALAERVVSAASGIGALLADPTD